MVLTTRDAVTGTRAEAGDYQTWNLLSFYGLLTLTVRETEITKSICALLCELVKFNSLKFYMWAKLDVNFVLD